MTDQAGLYARWRPPIMAKTHHAVLLMVLFVLAVGAACRLASQAEEASPPTDVELPIIVGEVRQWVSPSDTDFYFDVG